MIVKGYDPVMTAEQFRETGISRVELENIYKHSDFITVHTPLTPETNNLLNEVSNLCVNVNCDMLRIL